MDDSSEQNTIAQVPTHGRLLGLDFGTRRVGLAVSNDEQTISSPLDNYSRRGEQKDSRYLIKIVSEYGIDGIVVGLPVHMSGDEGGKAQEARQFGDWVAGVTGCPVGYWDERFTSQLADDHLFAASMTKKQRKARRDKLAAQILLQSYLDATDRELKPTPIHPA
ncbi:MAG: Holliday junction resolvase RuvX [Planctomycetaceae bacterium]|jgi:putative holliday junction resolvase|nr:Holliday junction resolvase RuvX [Planctomycetaceae bacterium]MBT6485810.1 Holliday junction resolvase RuvX [Planctomycetaceae bacterium]MBT6497932.1 Holliday junction resolvase RuvX [Planctomycetaceae bacterium]